MLALVDTGSNLHAADCEVHFPQYAKLVRAPKHSKVARATTAGGHKLDHLGKFTVDATTDFQDVTIPFNHMKVKLPILSVRQMLGKGSVMTLTEDSGLIQNHRTGHSIRFLIQDGLWYMKLKVKPPTTNEDTSASPFGRQGKA